MRILRVFLVLIVVSLPAAADTFSFTANGYLGDGVNLVTGTFSVVSPSTLTITHIVNQNSGYGTGVALFDNSTRAYISDWTNLQHGTYLYAIFSSLLLQPNGDPFTGAFDTESFHGFSCTVAECGAYVVNSDVEVEFSVQDAPTQVPEPGTIILLASGLAGAASWRRR